MVLLFELFLSFLQIGAFSFGGGYAAMPLIQEQVVNLHGWLTMSEFSDLITISQMTPGPIAINSATFVGERIAGIPGALVATLGCVLPSLIIVVIISMLYVKYRNLPILQAVLKYLRPVVIAMIFGSGVSMLLSAVFGSETTIALVNANYLMALFFMAALVVLLAKPKTNPIVVMVLCGVANVAAQLILQWL